MLERALPRTFLRSSTQQPLATCLLCQCRTFSTTKRCLAGGKKSKAHKAQKAQVKANKQQEPQPASPEAQKPPKGADQLNPVQALLEPDKPQGPLEHAPSYWGKRVREFTPTVLSRPIGMSSPPHPGQNTGIDVRTWRQKRDDFVNWDKHLEKRKHLKEVLSRPYFRDWTNLNLHKGKTFLSPPRLFRRDVSLYFPNLFGRTLLKTTKLERDTTPVLHDMASVVVLYNGRWAEHQAQSFASREANPALHEVLDKNARDAQLVRIHMEDDTLKYWLVRLLAMGSLRRRVGKDNWDKYFIVRKGVTDEICQRIGLLNRKVGYVYLVDGECRIRWAGSGPSQLEETESLAKGLHKLVHEKQKGLWFIQDHPPA